MFPATFLLALSASATLTGGFLLHHGSLRNVTRILKVTNGMPWGDWHSAQFCSAKSYAVGYSMKIEQNQHGHDDTALNVITLYCENLDGAMFGGEIYSGEGPWGDRTVRTDCDKGHYLTSFALQAEPDQGGGDDTAANYVKFHCRPFFSSTQDYELVTPPGHGLFGVFGEWSDSCDVNSAICGLSTRVESDQHGGDDTALNDVKFFCCND